jgi:cytochrome c oxidase assembly factor CtaG
MNRSWSSARRAATRPWLVLGLAAAIALLPVAALAHGEPAGRPTIRRLVTNWDFDPYFIIVAGGITWLYLSMVERVDRAHPKAPFPRRRVVAFLAGMAVIAVALVSPIARYDGDLFVVHMWQHILLTMVAAPLLLLGTPITLGLRAARPRVRRDVLLPVLHSRLLRALTFPVVAWLLFAAVMWGSHFSPLFNLALENVWLHRMEHLLYVTAGLLFWWPVVGLDPTPWRMAHPIRALYVFLQMPQNSFLALSIYNTDRVLYRHYLTSGRTWGPSPLRDQQLAGITMWIIGDLLFLAAVGFVIAGWVKAEELEAKRQDRLQAKRKAEAIAAAASNGGP